MIHCEMRQTVLTRMFSAADHTSYYGSAPFTAAHPVLTSFNIALWSAVVFCKPSVVPVTAETITRQQAYFRSALKVPSIQSLFSGL